MQTRTHFYVGSRSLFLKNECVGPTHQNDGLHVQQNQHDKGVNGVLIRGQAIHPIPCPSPTLHGRDTKVSRFLGSSLQRGVLSRMHTSGAKPRGQLQLKGMGSLQFLFSNPLFCWDDPDNHVPFSRAWGTPLPQCHPTLLLP